MKRKARTVKKAVAAELAARLRDVKKKDDSELVGRIEESLDALRRRPCRRTMALFGVPSCAKTFVPDLTISRTVTQTHCSPECGMLMMAERVGGWTRGMLVGTIAKMTAADPERAARVRAERVSRLRRARENRSGERERTVSAPGPSTAPRSSSR